MSLGLLSLKKRLAKFDSGLCFPLDLGSSWHCPFCWSCWLCFWSMQGCPALIHQESKYLPAVPDVANICPMWFGVWSWLWGGCRWSVMQCPVSICLSSSQNVSLKERNGKKKKVKQAKTFSTHSYTSCWIWDFCLKLDVVSVHSLPLSSHWKRPAVVTQKEQLSAYPDPTDTGRVCSTHCKCYPGTPQSWQPSL